MRQYDLDMPLVARVLTLLVLALFSVVFPALFMGEGTPRFLIVPLVALVAWQWWMVLSLAYRIVIHEDGTVEWIALARKVRMRPEDVREIRPDRSGHIGFLRVEWSGRKVRFVNQITGLHEVVAHIKAHNPTVLVRGC